MSELTQLFYYISGTLVTMVVWAIRLEGRVKTQETLTAQRHADIKELFGSKLDDIARRLSRIEVGMNGHLTRE